jgi:hypothetical protein
MGVLKYYPPSSAQHLVRISWEHTSDNDYLSERRSNIPVMKFFIANSTAKIVAPIWKDLVHSVPHPTTVFLHVFEVLPGTSSTRSSTSLLLRYFRPHTSRQYQVVCTYQVQPCKNTHRQTDPRKISKKVNTQLMCLNPKEPARNHVTAIGDVGKHNKIIDVNFSSIES